MNDESILWRPRPPSIYQPMGKVLTVPGQMLIQTAETLRAFGRLEAACLWLGTLDERGNAGARALVVPAQVNRQRNYSVPGSSMLAVAELARRFDWTVVGAVHSHPGGSVEHSSYDDEMTPSRRAVSIVMPSYGNWSGQWPRGLGVHEYFEGYWHLLSEAEASARVQVSSEASSQTFDLR